MTGEKPHPLATTLIQPFGEPKGRLLERAGGRRGTARLPSGPVPTTVSCHCFCHCYKLQEDDPARNCLQNSSLANRGGEIRCRGKAETLERAQPARLLATSCRRAAGETFERAKLERLPHSRGGACTHVYTVAFTHISAISLSLSRAHSSSFRYSYGYSCQSEAPGGLEGVYSSCTAGSGNSLQ
jgi:hypothetical protein